MRTATAFLAVFLAVPMVCPAENLAAGDGGGPGSTVRLPAALDKYYPPVAAQPVYLFKMLKLETSFSGIVVDLMEDDMEGARGSFADFQRDYGEAAAMVPEWKDAFPAETMKELGAALASGDKTKVMSAYAALGGACHACHAATMVPVQQKYRWGSMGALKVKDPLSGETTGYSPFKRYMAANLAGIMVDLKQGQTENARKQFQGFRARFQALTETCRSCHTEKSKPYIDGDVQDALEKIGDAFTRRAVDGEEISVLTRTIGEKSCSKCHLVHVPAALAGVSRN